MLGVGGRFAWEKCGLLEDLGGSKRIGLIIGKERKGKEGLLVNVKKSLNEKRKERASYARHAGLRSRGSPCKNILFRKLENEFLQYSDLWSFIAFILE